MRTTNKALEEYKESLKKPVIAKIVVPLEKNEANINEVVINCRTEDEIKTKMKLIEDLGFEAFVDRGLGYEAFM